MYIVHQVHVTHTSLQTSEEIFAFQWFHIYALCSRNVDNRNGMQFMETLIEFSTEWYYFAFNEICHETCTMHIHRTHSICATTSKSADAQEADSWQNWKPSASSRASQFHKLLLLLLAWVAVQCSETFALHKLMEANKAFSTDLCFHHEICAMCVHFFLCSRLFSLTASPNYCRTNEKIIITKLHAHTSLCWCTKMHYH